MGIKLPSSHKNRICRTCQIEKPRRRFTKFAIFPEELGFLWCSDKCLMIWLVIHTVKENGNLVTGIVDNKTGKEFNCSNLKPEDMDIEPKILLDPLTN